jgi:hypothetical protein
LFMVLTTLLLQGAVVLKESVAYGRMLLQSLFSPEPQNTPHIARYAVLFANSLGAEPMLSADVLGVTHLVNRAGGGSDVLHSISGLVAEAACNSCIQAAANVTGGSLSARDVGTLSVATDLSDRNATVEQLLSAAIVIAGSGSSGIADHDAAAGIAMLSLAVRVSRSVQVCIAPTCPPHAMSRPHLGCIRLMLTFLF